MSPTDACVCTVENAHDDHVNVLSWNANEPLIVTGGDDATLKIWSLKTIQVGRFYGFSFVFWVLRSRLHPI